MYPNLKAELARRNIKLEELAELLGKNVSTISLKLRGLSSITLGEAVKIKRHIESIKVDYESDLSIEFLFKEAG